MKVATVVRGGLRKRGTTVRTRSSWEGLKKKKIKWQIKPNYPIRGGLVKEETPCWQMITWGSRLGAMNLLRFKDLDLTVYLLLGSKTFFSFNM